MAYSKLKFEFFLVLHWYMSELSVPKQMTNQACTLQPKQSRKPCDQILHRKRKKIGCSSTAVVCTKFESVAYRSRHYDRTKTERADTMFNTKEITTTKTITTDSINTRRIPLDYYNNQSRKTQLVRSKPREAQIQQEGRRGFWRFRG